MECYHQWQSVASTSHTGKGGVLQGCRCVGSYSRRGIRRGVRWGVRQGGVLGGVLVWVLGWSLARGIK